MSTYFEKSQHPDLNGGGVNPYGQPDRKKTVFFMTSLSLIELILFPLVLYFSIDTF